jgi:hypothetical protein
MSKPATETLPVVAKRTSKTSAKVAKKQAGVVSGEVDPRHHAGHPEVSSPRRRGSSNPGNAAEYWVPAFAGTTGS